MSVSVHEAGKTYGLRSLPGKISSKIRNAKACDLAFLRVLKVQSYCPEISFVSWIKLRKEWTVDNRLAQFHLLPFPVFLRSSFDLLSSGHTPRMPLPSSALVGISESGIDLSPKQLNSTREILLSSFALWMCILNIGKLYGHFLIFGLDRKIISRGSFSYTQSETCKTS